MGRRVEVPITPSVLKWAIAESGYTEPEVSSWIEGGEATLASWLSETAKPSLSEMRTIAGKLHRQLATFLLPEPPDSTGLSIHFRHPLGGPARPLNPVERRYVRRATRIQTAHAWLHRELGHGSPKLPAVDLGSPSINAAGTMRALLGVTIDQQRGWRTASLAFDEWRQSVERLGVLVFLFPMGDSACRGFSLWDDSAPLVAINTRWRDEARIFTLFHELGHLVTRSDSACQLSETSVGHASDPAERWCEAFAAAVLVPAAAVRALPDVHDLRHLAKLADQFKVSLRAMAITLIGAGRSDWTLYRTIPAHADNKRDGGGGTGRNRREIREDEFGHRGTGLFVEAVRREVITESQALDYLDVPSSEFAHLAGPGNDV